MSTGDGSHREGALRYLFALALGFSLLCSCRTGGAPVAPVVRTVSVGMDLSGAIEALEAVGGREVVLALEPPLPPPGAYIEVRDFELDATRAVSLIAEGRDGMLAVVQINVCENMDMPAAQREWRTRQRLDVATPP